MKLQAADGLLFWRQYKDYDEPAIGNQSQKQGASFDRSKGKRLTAMPMAYARSMLVG